LLKQSGASVASFVRIEVGEGIEKKEEDFAAEVEAQVRASQ
jgi:elongation factor Ts